MSTCGVRSKALPRLEALETRCVLSTSVVEMSGTLLIRGDARANDIVIKDNGQNAAGNITVTVDGVTTTSVGNISTIVVRSGNQDDTVSYQLTGDLAASATRNIRVLLGNGSDTFTGSLGGDVLTGANLHLAVFGGNGKDTLNFNAADSDIAGATDVTPSASVSVALHGGNGKDTVGFGYAGLLNGLLSLTATGGNGKDQISGNLTVNPGSTGSLEARVRGGNGKDDLTLMVHDNSGAGGNSTLTELSAKIDGGRGKDTFLKTDNVEAVRVEINGST
jgi:hypothetical protein